MSVLMNWAYCTNGFRDHPLDQTLEVLADLGYTGAAVSLDHGHLMPGASPAEVGRIAALAGRLGLALAVETGGRFTLDPRRKHFPTLLHDEAEARVRFLCRAMRVAADLGAPVVHLWSGIRPPEVPEDEAWDRLVRQCERLLAEADTVGVTLGFEPEPGMLVADLAGYERLRGLLGGHPKFGLTLDIGHCRCLEPYDVPECVERALPHLVHVQIEDMRRGVHEHLEFGEGEIDFPPVLAALDGYGGLVAVELARHSHAAPDVARRSIEFLRRAHDLAGAGRSDVERDPETVYALFPRAAREGGPGARAELLRALGKALPDPAAAVMKLYWQGDAGERLEILESLPQLDLGPAALPVVHDALRTNDTRLVAAALGPYGSAWLDDHAFRQGVLKCVFMSVPLASVEGLGRRFDEELRRMLADFAAERRAAGRPVPPDVLERL